MPTYRMIKEYGEAAKRHGVEMRDGRDDLTLEEVLTDPLIRAVMKADGVDPQALAAELRRVAEEIDWQHVIPSLSRSPQECCVSV